MGGFGPEKGVRMFLCVEDSVLFLPAEFSIQCFWKIFEIKGEGGRFTGGPEVSIVPGWSLPGLTSAASLLVAERSYSSTL
jgi:hypothetical protein